MNVLKVVASVLVLAGCASDDGAPAPGAGGYAGAGGLVGGAGGVPTGGTNPGGAGGAFPTGGTNPGGAGGSLPAGGAGGSLPTGGAGGLASGGASGGGPGSGGGGNPDGTACAGQNMLPVSADPSVRGPWAVGVKTVKIGRLTVEVTYPAAVGSEAGKQEATYDIRDWLPKNPVQPSNYTKIEDRESPAVKPIGGKLFRDLPLDTEHGPYPVIIFMHGTSSFRIASGSTQTHWASRGFVVLAADYPGLMLADQLCSAGCQCAASGQADYPGDFKAQLDALKAGTGDVAFLKDKVDMTRVGLSGHSVGGCTVATQAALPGVQVIIPLSSVAPVPAGTALKSAMFVSGIADTVFQYTTGMPSEIGNVVCPGASPTVQDAYTATAGDIKRVVGITDGGHLLPTDLCQTNADNKNAITVLHDHHYCGVDSVAVIGLPALFDCGKNNFDFKVGVDDVNYVTTAALEETLKCQDRAAAITNARSAKPSIGDFKEAKK